MILPVECMVYINPDGSVTFADLVDSMQPVAAALDPQQRQTTGFHRETPSSYAEAAMMSNDEKLVQAIRKLFEMLPVAEALAQKTDAELADLMLSYVRADMDMLSPQAALLEAIHDRLKETKRGTSFGHPRPVCPGCQTTMYPEHNGVTVVRMAYDPPQPQTLWYADLWVCKGCGHHVIIGFADNPYAEGHEPSFEQDLSTAMDGLYTDTFREYEKPTKPMPEFCFKRE